MRRGLQLVAAVGIAPFAIQRARAASCSTEASESLRASLNYTEIAANAKQACGRCVFFTAGGSCGNCSIMSDTVNPKGHCESWAAKG